jgi:hypothetical protein
MFDHQFDQQNNNNIIYKSTCLFDAALFSFFVPFALFLAVQCMPVWFFDNAPGLWAFANYIKPSCTWLAGTTAER